MGLIKSHAPNFSLPLFVYHPGPPPLCLSSLCPSLPPPFSSLSLSSPSLLPTPLPYLLPPSPLLISQHSTEDEPVEHGVTIIADTDSWTCRLVVATRDSQTK